MSSPPVAAVALLDVNVLVALFFPDHIHHDVAHDWFAEHRASGWATCPLTVNGLVRVACQQQLPSDQIIRADTMLGHLRKFCKDKHHKAWTDSVDLADEALFAPQFFRGPAQITDVYLLGLAKARGGTLATFDRTIPLDAVRGATRKHLQIIAPT